MLKLQRVSVFVFVTFARVNSCVEVSAEPYEDKALPCAATWKLAHASKIKSRKGCIKKAGCIVFFIVLQPAAAASFFLSPPIWGPF